MSDIESQLADEDAAILAKQRAMPMSVELEKLKLWDDLLVLANAYVDLGIELGYDVRLALDVVNRARELIK